jgi:hypothetical protein
MQCSKPCLQTVQLCGAALLWMNAVHVFGHPGTVLMMTAAGDGGMEL